MSWIVLRLTCAWMYTCNKRHWTKSFNLCCLLLLFHTVYMAVRQIKHMIKIFCHVFSLCLVVSFNWLGWFIFNMTYVNIESASLDGSCSLLGEYTYVRAIYLHTWIYMALCNVILQLKNHVMCFFPKHTYQSACPYYSVI